MIQRGSLQDISDEYKQDQKDQKDKSGLYKERFTLQSKTPAQLLLKSGTLAPFFIHKLDYVSAPPMSFIYPKLSYGPLKVAQPDVTELTRSSCAAMVKHSRYIDINYALLPQYAESLNKENIDEYLTQINAFQSGMEDIVLSERDVINMSCFFVLLQYGSGFRSILNKFCVGHGVSTMQNGMLNMYKNYPKLDVKSLKGITIGDVANFFEIDITKSLALKSLCDMMRKCIKETVHILELKQLNDFADYIYHYIDMAWIKSQTKNLSAIKTIEWELTKEHKLGLTLAPTKSEIVRRCVVIDFVPSNDDEDNTQNNEVCRDLVARGAFLYAVNDLVVYNRPFDEIIPFIKGLLDATDANEWNPFEYRMGDKRIVALQFGLHLNDEPETMQTLLFNFINDFSALNDQYLYQSFFAPRKHLRIYLFQSVQSIIMELYYNLFVRADRNERNPIFNFKGISTLTGVVDNVIPFILLQDGILSLKGEYKEDWRQYIDGCYILRTSDLEAEIMASAIWALELLLKESKIEINIAKLTYFLRNKGKLPQYEKYAKFHTRGALSSLSNN